MHTTFPKQKKTMKMVPCQVFLYKNAYKMLCIYSCLTLGLGIVPSQAKFGMSIFIWPARLDPIHPHGPVGPSVVTRRPGPTQPNKIWSGPRVGSYGPKLGRALSRPLQPYRPDNPRLVKLSQVESHVYF